MSSFSFKKFTIRQDRCAMKVCTDACLFGAWVTHQLKHELSQMNNALDIGAGTGLLSLMIAQQATARIDAIEMIPEAAVQCGENFAASPWSERLNVIETDVKEFTFLKPYDLIISNPPFYEHDLLSPQSEKNAAMHDSTLKLDELLAIIRKNLPEKGYAAVLIPFKRMAYFETLMAKNGLFLFKKATVRQTPAHAAFRAMYILAGKERSWVNDEMIIREDEQCYTISFTALLRDYYLYL